MIELFFDQVIFAAVSLQKVTRDLSRLWLSGDEPDVATPCTKNGGGASGGGGGGGGAKKKKTTPSMSVTVVSRTLPRNRQQVHPTKMAVFSKLKRVSKGSQLVGRDPEFFNHPSTILPSNHNGYLFKVIRKGGSKLVGHDPRFFSKSQFNFSFQ